MTRYLTNLITISLVTLAVSDYALGYNESITKPQLLAIQKGISFDYQPEVLDNIKNYYVSEKLDGMRGFWDGKKLLSRGGNIIATPLWFTRDWPTTPMDGELYLGLNSFQSLMSCVKGKSLSNEKKRCWRRIRFMIFDLPKHQGNFNQRVQAMTTIAAQTTSDYLKMITQEKVTSEAHLEQKLTQVIAKQGEGLMLHLSHAHYLSGTNSALLKIKRFNDDEAVVVGYTKGKGKFQGKTGALIVKLSNNTVFKIGSGLTDALRATPPPLGSTITFKYNGLTQAGIPRFARFWRVRPSE